jgi:ribosomal protein S18 acetylase RimI-like enzyme
MTMHERLTLSLNLDIHLRLAVHEDLHKLEWFGQYTHFRGLFRRAFREQQEGRRLMLIADCADFPIGHIFMQLSSNEPAVAQSGNRAYFYAFRVMDMFRGRGIGTALIHEAEALVYERGYRWATIAVAKDNPDALRLYERVGYRIFRDDDGEWSYRDHRGEMRWVHEPCWLLEKRLMF